MAKSGEVSAEFRLLTTKLKADLDVIRAAIQKGLKFDLGSKQIETAAGAMGKLAQNTNVFAGALRDAAKAYRQIFGSVAGQLNKTLQVPAIPTSKTPTIRDVSRSGSSGVFTDDTGVNPGAGSKPWSTTAGGGLATTPPYIGATPPIVPPPIIPQKPSVLSMFNSAITTPLSAVGQVSTKVFAGLAALRVGIGLVTYPFRLLSQTMMPVVRMFTQAAEAARAMYAKSLSSGGLPLGFTAHRSMLAEVIGVSENEVLHYGDAVAYLNGKLAYSSQTIANNSRILTDSAWKMKTVGMEWKALMSNVAGSMADAGNKISAATGGLIHNISKHVAETNTYREQFKFAASQLKEREKAGGWGLYRAIFPRATADTRKFMETPEFKKMWAEHMKNAGAPMPSAGAHRYATSQWERMGMVIGLGSSNPAAQTARNTQNMAATLKTIAGYLRGGPPRANGVPAWAYSQP